jgi:hypothetical protein
MKYIFAIIVLLHGIIHTLGFVKAFSLAEIKELSLPISKPMGIVWLLSAILFVIYLCAYFYRYPFSWVFGLFAVTISQILIILYLNDAKFGTLPNIIILLVVIVSLGHYSFQKLVDTETRDMLAKTTVTKEKIISQRDIATLPAPVKKWLIRSGVIGKPFISVAKVQQLAQLKMKPEQDTWYNATAYQYTTIDVPSFIWVVDVTMNSLLGFQGRDRFVDGKGEMLIKLHSVINVVNEKGHKLDEGALQRYLGEMVWFPSLALSPYITWKEVDNNTATATMEYKGTKGSGTFYFNSEGDFVKFSALRYMGNDPNVKRYEWVVVAEDYKTFEGIKVPSKMTATWKLESGYWTWIKLEIVDIKYNYTNSWQN